MKGECHPPSAIGHQKREISFSLFLSIFLVSVATLSLEITLTRLLAVAQGHHFAFMVVSMALLGFGASGSFLSSFPSILKREGFLTMIVGSWLFSLSALLAYFVSNLIPFDLARLSWDRWQIFYLFLYYLLFSVPFFFAGLTISSALTHWSRLSGKLYFADLCGAACGCLAVLFLFGFLGGTGTLLFSCLLGALASLFFGFQKKMNLFLSVARWSWVGLILFLLCGPPPWLDLRLSPYKGLNMALLFPGARLLETHWNAFSRIDVLESPAARSAPGLSLEYLDPLPPQLGLTIDADRLKAITRVEGRENEKQNLKFLEFLPSAFPYRIIKPKRVLIMEPSGGLEVINALHHQAKEIVAVEINPTVVELLKGKYRQYSGEIYLRPETRIMVGDGRNYVRGGPAPFDLIVFPLTESWAASSTGLSSLHEDYRLTSEAFQDYLKALKPDGYLFVSLFLIPPPRGELRLVSVVKEALEREGKKAGQHILAFRSWGTFSFLIKKTPVHIQEITALKSFCRQLRFDLVYYPGIKEEEANIYNRFDTPVYFRSVQKVLEEGERFYAAYPFDLHPATDDRPFFHHYFRWGHLSAIYRLAGEKWPILLEGGYLVPVVFFLALFFSFLFLLLPLLFSQREMKKQNIRQAHPVTWLTYFASLGLGFMLVEISLIQKFILFLGHPVYSVSLVLFSLLVFAGAGSRLSSGLELFFIPRLKLVLLAIVIFLFLYSFLLPQTLSFFQGKPLLIRQILTIFIIGPLGFLMGIPFPLGIRLLGEQWPFLVPWAWCANGCASVLGSILPVIVALAWGFQTVLLMSALLYGLGLFMAWKSLPPPSFYRSSGQKVCLK